MKETIRKKKNGANYAAVENISIFSLLSRFFHFMYIFNANVASLIYWRVGLQNMPENMYSISK